MWRSAIVTGPNGQEVRTAQKVIDRKEFRLEEGSPAEGALVIQLSDLVPSKIAQQLKDEDTDVKLEIPHYDLTKELEVAEADEKLHKAGERGGNRTASSGWTPRKHSRPPHRPLPVLRSPSRKRR
ncbi:MAG: hypothetical protein M1839_002054 [Geoglossum umbratile]|nr:MAG: hypothetical protein M1839_002054 [Geoglossum umbratile]